MDRDKIESSMSRRRETPRVPNTWDTHLPPLSTVASSAKPGPEFDLRGLRQQEQPNPLQACLAGLFITCFHFSLEEKEASHWMTLALAEMPIEGVTGLQGHTLACCQRLKEGGLGGRELGVGRQCGLLCEHTGLKKPTSLPWLCPQKFAV